MFRGLFNLHEKLERATFISSTEPLEKVSISRAPENLRSLLISFAAVI